MQKRDVLVYTYQHAMPVGRQTGGGLWDIRFLPELAVKLDMLSAPLGL